MEIYTSAVNVFLTKHSIPLAPFFKGDDIYRLSNMYFYSSKYQ